MVAGLAEGGVDLLDADTIVGTSAGSTVAAQITSGTKPGDLYAAILAEAPPPRHGAGRPGAGQGRRAAGRSHVEWSDAVIAAAADASDMRRRMGAAALALDPDGSGQRRWRDIVAT